MRLPPLTPGRFVQRDNRFRVTVEVDGERVAAHLPNSGRLTELLTPGRRCWLERFDSAHRKTNFDLKLMAYAGVLVSVDARLPNPLFAEALAADQLAPFQDCRPVVREVTLGDSRMDFRLGSASAPTWVEIKSVTLVEGGVARFPDAPTSRGARHVRELTEVVGAGHHAAIVFVVQRPDAERFAPHDGADPAFGAALREAARLGVEVYAWICCVDRRHIEIDRQIPVDLNSSS
jgi:sugar fermentation stimulation protein A